MGAITTDSDAENSEKGTESDEATEYGTLGEGRRWPESREFGVDEDSPIDPWQADTARWDKSAVVENRLDQ